MSMINVAQTVSDTYCEIMDEKGYACSDLSNCWKQDGGGCEETRRLFSTTLEAIQKSILRRENE